ncbi:MAG: helix-turn-helix transcriptional regulator [Bacilli bacterium]
MKKVNIEGKEYYFYMEDIMKERGISINQVMRDTNTDFKIVKKYMTGNLIRLDLFVLARFCNYFNCSIKDIVEYK